MSPTSVGGGGDGPAEWRRRGALRPDLVPSDVLESLQDGSLETVNFMEQFAIDLDKLLAARLPEARHADLTEYLPLKGRLTSAGQHLLRQVGADAVHRRVASECDTIRAVGGLAIGHAVGIPPSERLRMLKPFAEDSHFAVREWAWIGLRDSLGEDVVSLIPELVVWAENWSERTRRFASEILRARGVWCRHLRAVRDDPGVAMSVIERLRADPSSYVQASVGNWLNDASARHPVWVESVCARWTTENLGAATALITRRGLRTIRKTQAKAVRVPNS